MHKNWIIRNHKGQAHRKLTEKPGISELLARLLVNRGIHGLEAAAKFLDPKITDFLDPWDLPDMKKAVSRIDKAIKKKEKILICGDYDVDGICACVLLEGVLRKRGADVESYLPHRIREGYGISKEAVKIAESEGKDLVISVDCGISDFDELKSLKNAGIDTIVIDHHIPHADKLPPAFAIVNPKLKDSRYEFKDLAGVGVALKVAQALTGQRLEEELDVVALGTVADVVPLLGENRIIVKEGLKRLNSTHRHGIKALIEASGIKNKKISVRYISFVLGPRINAGGRMGDSAAPLELLKSKDETQAKELAKNLNLHNRRRQNIQEGIMNEAVSRIEAGEVDFANHHIIVLGGRKWHKGVLGIVASKISDRYNRPAIIVSFEEGVGKGSCRSIGNFHILEALNHCSMHLQDFGGHKYAAGITVLEKDMECFKSQINSVAKAILKPEDLLPAIEIDAEVGFSDLSHGLLQELDSFSPFGSGNPEPLFAAYNLRLKNPPEVLGRDTLKMWLTDGKITYQAVGFQMASLKDYIAGMEEFDVAFKLSIDNWQGRNELQIEIEDIRPCEPCLP